MEPQAEQIVSLKKDKREWLMWTINFWIVLVAISAMGILANLYPAAILEDSTLEMFNAKYVIIFAVLALLDTFFLFGAYLTKKKMDQGFTHYQKTYFKDDS